jgi:AmiR/NasT family two-component response regulator
VHVASVAIVNENAAADRDTINAQLRQALTRRIALEQAKRGLVYTGKMDMDQAFTVLRRHARDHGHKLTDVARRLVQRELRSEQ